MSAHSQSLTSPVLLSSSARAEIDVWLKKYPADQRQSAVLAALTIVQKENGGYLTNPLMDAVAAYIGMPKIAVYEVATFYSMYELKPVGKHHICICTNVSCELCGSEAIVEYFEKKLGIKMGQVTPDGKFSLKSVECLAACQGAPLCQIGDDYHENLTPQKIDALLASLK